MLPLLCLLLLTLDFAYVGAVLICVWELLTRGGGICKFSCACGQAPRSTFKGTPASSLEASIAEANGELNGLLGDDTAAFAPLDGGKELAGSAFSKASPVSEGEWPAGSPFSRAYARILAAGETPGSAFSRASPNAGGDGPAGSAFSSELHGHAGACSELSSSSGDATAAHAYNPRGAGLAGSALSGGQRKRAGPFRAGAGAAIGQGYLRRKRALQRKAEPVSRAVAACRAGANRASWSAVPPRGAGLHGSMLPSYVKQLLRAYKDAKPGSHAELRARDRLWAALSEDSWKAHLQSGSAAAGTRGQQFPSEQAEHGSCAMRSEDLPKGGVQSASAAGGASAEPDASLGAGGECIRDSLEAELQRVSAAGGASAQHRAIEQAESAPQETAAPGTGLDTAAVPAADSREWASSVLKRVKCTQTAQLGSHEQHASEQAESAHQEAAAPSVSLDSEAEPFENSRDWASSILEQVERARQEAELGGSAQQRTDGHAEGGRQEPAAPGAPPSLWDRLWPAQTGGGYGAQLRRESAWTGTGAGQRASKQAESGSRGAAAPSGGAGSGVGGESSAWGTVSRDWVSSTTTWLPRRARPGAAPGPRAYQGAGESRVAGMEEGVDGADLG